MKVKKVDSPALARLFLEMPQSLYRTDKNYIRPLDNDVEDIFDPSKNTLFVMGQCCRWLLFDTKENCVGRIAAFYDKVSSIDYLQPTGGCGFFECIDEEKAAFLLFDTARNWLAEHGMEAMDGPINFGSRERWWGLLVEGFTEPCYCSNYNPPYYQKLFESYGFQVYYKQYTYRRTLEGEIGERYANKAKRLLGMKGYSFDFIKRKHLSDAAEQFREVYNKAWVKHDGVGEMTKEQADKLMRNLKPVVDPIGLWFAYFEGEPIGFFISIPDVNQLFIKYVRGKIGLKGIFMLCWNKFFKKCKTLFGIVFGVVPAHQRKGVEVALIMEAAKIFINGKSNTGYEELQMNWIGDFNPKMMNLANQIGAYVYKTHHTYRYLFDREKPFERHPIL
ncbi:hypothetical protein [Olivibacter domesticus]|uniref:N-acetyltransferase domain-containing protein n=1 Tax=Olivibacter domesticus TaxID=407022 RepID=A0A1H7VDP9_OLID1|nr:hypothetical protein [Olivibacter domesticus]SEM07009.1 hypothetical protein SAMN05661044_04124 [Olivibacter domesticus]